MKIYAPKYYSEFKCIADKCKHSCCIGWEIDIDKSTLNKFSTMTHPYSENINNSIEFSDNPHFVLNANDNCPHLNEKGLCKIILNCGEDYICNICREHPRFYNFTNVGKEIGIGMSCEAACDLILNSDNFDEMIEVDRNDSENIEYEFNAVEFRQSIFGLLKSSDLLISDVVNKICESFNIDFSNINFSESISSLEYLHEEDEILFANANTLCWNNEISDELKRIVAYFIYRHCSEAIDEEDFITSLCFSIYCTGLISTLSEKSNINDIARRVSEEIEYSESNTETIKYMFIPD